MLTDEECLVYKQLAPYVLSILGDIDGGAGSAWLVAYPRTRKEMCALGLIEETDFLSMRWQRTELGNKIIRFHELVEEILYLPEEDKFAILNTQ